MNKEAGRLSPFLPILFGYIILGISTCRTYGYPPDYLDLLLEGVLWSALAIASIRIIKLFGKEWVSPIVALILLATPFLLFFSAAQ